jgi:hypothetical protein
VTGSAIAVIAVVVAGTFLGVRAQGETARADVSLNVRDGARNVRSDLPLVFTASRTVTRASLEAALHLQPAAAGSLSGSSQGRRFIWQPDPALAGGTRYTLRLDSLRDTGGRPLRGGLWHFETSLAPRVLHAVLDSGAAVVEGARLPLGSALTLTFDQAMDPASVRVLANGTPMKLTWAADRRSARLEAQGLKAGKLQLELVGGRDVAGHAAAGWRLGATLVDTAPGSTGLRAPALVQISNDAGSRDQSGLQAAGTVYEYLTEGGITRFTALFSSAPPVLGPVNSGRLISLRLARHYRGMLFMSDLSRGSMARLQAEPLPTSLTVQNLFYRSPDRPSPDDLFVTGASIERAEERLGVTPASPSPPFPMTIGGDSSARVTVDEHRSTYTYDPASASYTKVEDDHQLLDTATGSAVRIRLLVVLHTTATQTSYPEDAAGHRGLDYDLDSNGAADFYMDGKHARGRWSAPDRNGPIDFSLADGTSVAAADGLTWVDVVTD